MPLVAIIVAALGSFLGRAVFKVIAVLGIAKLSYEGAQATLDFLEGKTQHYIQQIPSEYLTFFGYFEVDRMLSILFSALAISVTIRITSRFI